ncbi:hypothetical protein AVEN_242898-1 [Araneus ventricosus]|uniref:Uncharacterized protein n=1 Tax=Araneus ventricosus TaxID=182803 RepID=A0A4Y2H464_ARAVE|nr:hypothetical protein AVEN_242898-1 [Araneus ventricosus]
MKSYQKKEPCGLQFLLILFFSGKRQQHIVLREVPDEAHLPLGMKLLGIFLVQYRLFINEKILHFIKQFTGAYLAAVNAWVNYKEITGIKMKRRDFILNLADELCLIIM